MGQDVVPYTRMASHMSIQCTRMGQHTHIGQNTGTVYQARDAFTLAGIKLGLARVSPPYILSCRAKLGSARFDRFALQLIPSRVVLNPG